MSKLVSSLPALAAAGALAVAGCGLAETGDDPTAIGVKPTRLAPTFLDTIQGYDAARSRGAGSERGLRCR